MKKSIYTISFIILIPLIFWGFRSKDTSTKVFKHNTVKKGFYNTSYGKVPFGSILIIDQVKQNDYISSIFSRYKVSHLTTHKISLLPDTIFSAKKIRHGNKYGFILANKGERFIPQKFIYEKNKIEYYVINIEEEIQVLSERKRIEYVEKTTHGIITSSLYETMVENNANPLLAINLSEIYAWSIDFYRIQKNDFFKVHYLEAMVEGESIGDFKILASVFNHFGNNQYAFYYEKDSTEFDGRGDYYDDEGNSKRGNFLKAPVKYSRISSRYSGARFHPVTKQMKAHLGTDYAAPHGTPIYSTANGVVVAASYTGGNGYYVKVKHNSVYTTQYLHMSKFAKGIKAGVYVKQGDVIGYVGSTGLATGPHVCYRFWKNGQQVDPYREDLGKTDPMEAKHLPAYLEYIGPLKEKITIEEDKLPV